MTQTKSTAQIDLAAFDGLAEAQEEGIEVAILHPGTGEDLGIVIRVAGPDSARQRQAREQQVDRRLRKRSAKPLSAGELADAARRTLAAAVIGWNRVVIDGKEIPFSTEAAVALFQRFPWIQEQVDQAAGSRAD